MLTPFKFGDRAVKKKQLELLPSLRFYPCRRDRQQTND